MMGRFIRTVLGLSLLTVIGAGIGAALARHRIFSFGDPDSDEIGLVAIYESTAFRSESREFKSGVMTCWYGGGQLDLRDATLDPSGARLSIRAIFGGGEVIVPDEWAIDLNVTGILGGVGDTRPPRDRPADAPRLFIDGFAFCGGFGVGSKPYMDGLPTPQSSE